jgi:glycosyltransferase involved in cell wall biosynthesis
MTRPRSLILLARSPDPDWARRVDAGEVPRIEYLDLANALGATIFTFHDVERSSHPAVVAARKRSLVWGLAMLGIVKRHDFDHVYTTGEDVGIPFGILVRTVRWFGHVTCVIHHGGTVKRTLALRGLGHGIWRNLICLSDRQWEVLIKEVGLPRHKVHRFAQWVDHEFFSESAARPHASDYVLSCGRESRDYPTLQNAARGMSVKFHVVASGWGRGGTFDPALNVEPASNIEIKQGLPHRELRDAYAGARFVVVPLDKVDYAAGVTSMCEAMAMGKALVVSASPGVADYVKHDETGLVVPVGDAAAMRDAVQTLWNDPARCARMGQSGRRWVEAEFTVPRYVGRVSGLLGVSAPAEPASRHIPSGDRLAASAVGS